MKIGIIKMGKVVSFDKTKWTTKGGDNQSVDVIQTLLDDNNQVYMISASDVQKCKSQGIIPKQRKLYDAWIGHTRMKKILNQNLPFDNDQVYKSLDGVIIFNGGMPNNAFPKEYNPHGLKTLQMYQRYVFPPIMIYKNYCQYWKMGSIYILVDNRYYPKLYDYCSPWNMKNPPKKILSQANQSVTLQRKYGGPITFNSTHEQMECMFMYKRKAITNVPKQNKFIVFQHASGIPKWRWQQLEKFVFDLPFDFTIHGDWHDAVLKGMMKQEQYNNGSFKVKSANFKPPLPLLQDMYKTYQKTKYTFVCSKGSTAKKWSTAKYLEAIANGCIPFVPRDEYDCDGISIPKDSYLRVSDGKQLQQKIDYLQNNKQAYQKLLKETIQYYCSEDRFNGKFLLNKIYKALEET